MKLVSLLVLLALSVLFSGCISTHVPPGECAYWEHTGNFGPYQSHVVAHGVSKNTDGTFRIADYTGSATWLGFGPHDVVQGLVVGAAPSAK